MFLFHKDQFVDLLSGFDRDVVTFDSKRHICETGAKKSQFPFQVVANKLQVIALSSKFSDIHFLEKVLV